MTIEQLLENEKSSLLDYVHGYCTNPLATASEDLVALFKKYNVEEDDYTIRDILSSAYERAYFCTTPPSNTDSSIWIDISEIECEADQIEPEEKEEYTIINDYAYYYVGYGLMIEYSYLIIVQQLNERAYERAQERSLYTCVHYHDVWKNIDGYEVNNLSKIESDIYLDVNNMSDRELYLAFADIVGMNKRLRAIEVHYYDSSFIEFIYTARAVDGFYPLGRFELQVF